MRPRLPVSFWQAARGIADDQPAGNGLCDNSQENSQDERLDYRIHSFAGVQLREECGRKMRQLKIRYGRDYEQPTAVPMLTEAYNLPAKKIIHIVGPIVYDRLTPDLEEDLADCYRNSLDLCLDQDLKTIAFCCISTGVFRFPNRRAAEIAVETVSRWMTDHPGQIERVIFNVFKEEDKIIYEELI